jgi:hypothetical protein
MADYNDGRLSGNVIDKRTNVPGQGLYQPDIPKVKRNIKRMLDQGAPEADIDAYLGTEGVTLEQLGGRDIPKGKPAPGSPESFNPERTDWTPEMREAYAGRQEFRKKIEEQGGSGMRPGYARRALHSTLLGGGDELAAGIQTIIETPFKEGGFRDRFNQNWAAEQADLDRMYEDTDGALGVAADVAGGLATGGAPRSLARNAMLRAAAPALPAARPGLVRQAAHLAGTGAAWGGGHSFLSEEGSVADRLEAVPSGMAQGATYALGIGAGLKLLGSARSRLRARRERLAADAQARRQEFDDAGVEVFGPAISDSPTVQRSAQGLGGTIVGTPLQEGASRSITGVQTRLNDMISRETGGTPPVQLAEELQGTLEHNLTQRNLQGVNDMSTEQLQDITGLSLPDRHRPPPIRVEPAQPRNVEPLSPEAYLDEVGRAVPEADPVAPNPVRREDYNYRPETIPESAVDSGLPEARAYNQALLEVRKHINEHNSAVDILATREADLLREAEAIGMKIHQGKGERFITLPDNPGPEHRMFTRRFQAWQQERVPLENRIYKAQKFAERARLRFDDAEKALMEARKSRQLTAQSEADSRSLSREESDYRAAVERENQRANDKRALATQRAREEAIEAARPTAIQDAARRTEELRAQAADDARRETETRRQAAERQQQDELAIRRQNANTTVEVGRRADLTYPDEFDAAYAMSKRHAPPVQRNPLGSKNEVPRTNTVRVLEEIAEQARNAGKLPGYKRGQLFDDGGRLRSDFVEYLRPHLGDENLESLLYFSERRAKGQFVPSVNNLHLNRTEIGREIGEHARTGSGMGRPRNADHALLSRLYQALDEDINAFRNAAPGGEQASAIRQSLDAAYRQHQEEIRAPLARLFGRNITPETAMEQISRSAQGRNLNLVDAYMRVMSEKGNPQRAAAAVIQHMTRNARTMTEFLDELARITPETRDVLFRGNRGREYRAELERLEAVGRRLSPYERMSRGPRGFDLSNLAAASRPTNLLAAAGLYFHFWPAMVSMAGAGGIARFLSSPRYVRWLTELPRATAGGLSTERAAHHLARLVNITADDEETGDAILRAVFPMFKGGEGAQVQTGDSRKRNERQLERRSQPLRQ